MKTRWNPAAVSAALQGDYGNAIVAATPGGIEAQEAQGQKDFVNSTTLPIKCNFCNREQFEQMGIVFGEPVDDLFCDAQLPQGWHKERTDHSMHSTLLDDQGRKRAGIFYKAAFYDRDAFLSITVRYHTNTAPVCGWDAYNYLQPGMWHCVVTDGERIIWNSDAIGPEPSNDAELDIRLAWYAERDEYEKLGKAWLDDNYPEWKDPTAYWG